MKLDNPRQVTYTLGLQLPPVFWSRSKVLNLGFQHPLGSPLMGLTVPVNPLRSWTKCLFSHMHVFLDLVFMALKRFSKQIIIQIRIMTSGINGFSGLFQF